MKENIKDINGIVEFSHQIIPVVEGDEAIWNDAARIIVIEIIFAFCLRHGSSWEIRDLLDAASSDKATIKDIIYYAPKGRDVVEVILNDSNEKWLEVHHCLKSKIASFSHQENVS